MQEEPIETLDKTQEEVLVDEKIIQTEQTIVQVEDSPVKLSKNQQKKQRKQVKQLTLQATEAKNIQSEEMVVVALSSPKQPEIKSAGVITN